MVPHGFFMRPMIAAAKHVYETGRKLTPNEATDILWAEISIIPEIHANFTIGIDGTPGGGKSEVGQTIAFLYTELTGGEIQLGFDIDELQAELPRGSVNILDEYILPQGPGAVLAVKDLWNLISTVRVEERCFEIISPSLPEFKFINFSLFVFAQRGLFGEPECVNLATLSAPWKGRMVEIGEVMVPLHFDETFRKEYKERKQTRVAGILRTGGSKFIKSKVSIRDTAKTVVKEAKKEGVPLTSERVASGLMTDLHEEGRIPGLDTKKWGEVAAMARSMFRQEEKKSLRRRYQAAMPKNIKEEWAELRNNIVDTLLARGANERDAVATGKYLVPEEPLGEAEQVLKEMKLTILVDSLRKAIRAGRRRLTTTDKEALGEGFIHSISTSAHSDYSGAEGGGGDGVADLSGEVGERRWAMNIKLSLEEHFRRPMPSTPEDAYLPHAFLCVVLPRLLECRVYRITGKQTHVNTRRGGRLCAPSQVWSTVKRLMDNGEHEGDDQ